MDPVSVLLTALGLSMDCLAVAITGSLSARSHFLHQALRVSFSFGAFQSGMLILGWLAGRGLVNIIEGYDHWIAFALLLLVGARMIYESLSSEDGEDQHTDITRGAALIVLSVATSIDSLAVGLSLAFLRSKILITGVIVGSVTFLVSGAGFLLGRRIGVSLGRWAGVVGGVVLIGIGVKIILTHMF